MQVLIVWRSVCPVCTCQHRNTATFVWSTISLTTKTTTWPPESPSLTTPSPWAASWSSLVVSTRYQVSRIIQSSVNRILKNKAGLNRTCVYQQRPVHIRQLLNTRMNVVWRPVEIAGIWLEDTRTTSQVSATTKTRACASVEPDVDRLSSRYLVYYPNCIARDFFSLLRLFSRLWLPIVFQIKWNNPEEYEDMFDSSGIALYYTKNLRRYDVGTKIFSSTHFTIPSPRPIYAITSSYPSDCSQMQIKSPIYITRAFNHMHKYGKLFENLLVDIKFT